MERRGRVRSIRLGEIFIELGLRNKGARTVGSGSGSYDQDGLHVASAFFQFSTTLTSH